MSGPEDNPRDGEQLTKEEWEHYEQKKICQCCGHLKMNHTGFQSFCLAIKDGAFCTCMKFRAKP